MTVNKAIMSLVNEGLIYKEQGKGTFITIQRSIEKYHYLKVLLSKCKIMV